MKRVRFSLEVVAEVNGFQIEREKIGAAIHWNAVKIDATGYREAAFLNCGSKSAAIAKAEGRSS
jgi:hypothetical protein